MESGTEPSNVVKKLVFLEILYQHGCYLEIKKKLKVLCNLVRLALKKKMRVGKNEEFETVLTVFGWFKRM